VHGVLALLGRGRTLLSGAVVLLVLGVVAIGWGLHRPAGDRPPSAGAAATASGVPDVLGAGRPTAAPATATAPAAARAAPTARPLLPRATPLVQAPRPAARATPKPTPRATPGPTPVGPPVLGAARPVRLRIPALGISTRLLSLGINPDHSVGVPPGPHQIGWFRGSPAPGALGPAVILGHVSWLGTPAAFFKLATLKRGDTLSVSRSDGFVVTFTVQGSRSYPKDSFPTSRVYGDLDYAGLRLITCSGDYDSHRHFFPDNLVVFAQATGVHRA